MSLAPGRRIGGYEVTAPLGEGGMGVVYRATDSKLKREVAIKVLPPAFAEDAERLGRFEREARLLASLNHPNVAHVYRLREHGAPRRFGRSLPLDEALADARQIAEALEEAHEKGIVHRVLQ